MGSRRKIVNLSIPEILSGLVLLAAMFFIGADKEFLLSSISQTFQESQAQEAVTALSK